MSTNITPSSSLSILEQRNHSKSTVSSSDTDVDSAEYASSSGTTTPEDEARVFHLDRTLGLILDDKPTRAPPEKPSVIPRRRGISSAMSKVKKVAHALGVLTNKKKRPDDMSPILISSPWRERFGKRMSVRPRQDERLYNLPNRRFSFSDASTPSHHPRAISRKFGTISGSTLSFARGTIRIDRGGLKVPSLSDPQHSALPSSSSAPTTMDLRTGHDVPTFMTILLQVLRALLFLPWCTAVGGALLLFPSYVDLVTFRAGYISPLKGMRRFAYWAECGQQHVMIFLACLAVIIWYNRPLGLSLTSVAVSRAAFVWYGFEVDGRVPLGVDDQQSVYLVITGLASVDGSFHVSGQGSGLMKTRAIDSVREVAETE